jgi:hypothetical protein
MVELSRARRAFATGAAELDVAHLGGEISNAGTLLLDNLVFQLVHNRIMIRNRHGSAKATFSGSVLVRLPLMGLLSGFVDG